MESLGQNNNQTLRRAMTIIVIAIVCYFLQLVPVVAYIILCLFLVYLLYLLGLHLFATEHPERQWPTRAIKALERPLFFIVDFFESPLGKRVIYAGIQLPVVGVSLIILILVILGILNAEFIPQDYLKLFVAYLLIAIVAIAVSSKGFERFINERIFKSIPAPYSAEVAKN